MSKVDEFPWTNTNLFYQVPDDPNTILNEADQPIPDPVEEQIQEDISDEIKKELSEENNIIDEEPINVEAPPAEDTEGLYPEDDSI